MADGSVATSSSWARLAVATLLPFSVFVGHGSCFAGWEMDDAGISYAYARNLATGHGLVAQPGAEAVEGFTNLLWVVLLASVRWSAPIGLAVGLFGAVLLLGGFMSLDRLASRLGWPGDGEGRSSGALCLWLALGISYLALEILPTDWMPEGRLATPLLLVGPLALLVPARRSKLLLGVVSAVLLTLALGYSARHAPAFRRAPPVPLQSVRELATRLDAVGRLLPGARGATVLLPDIGGALWEDRFTVVDLGGLIDRRIARTLRQENQARFFDYVVERRPDLIWTHGYWKELADFGREARIAAEYEILFADRDHTLYLRSEAAAGVDRAHLLARFSADC